MDKSKTVNWLFGRFASATESKRLREWMVYFRPKYGFLLSFLARMGPCLGLRGKTGLLGRALNQWPCKVRMGEVFVKWEIVVYG